MNTIKRCIKCRQIKPIINYYKHKQMADGHLNKCINCAKKDVHKRYHDPAKKEQISAYEKARNKTPERKAKVHIYQLKRRENFPGKYKARTKVQNAVRDGIIKKLPCVKCGNSKSEGHHKDYRKYLDVVWLCRKHHRELHKAIKNNQPYGLPT